MAPDHGTGELNLDKLIQLWMKNGKEVCVLLHMEIQAQTKEDFPKRMFVYRYRTFDKHQQPVISVAILADDDPKWRPHLYVETPYPWPGYELRFPFVTVKLLDFKEKEAALAASTNPFATVILAYLAALETASKQPKSTKTRYLHRSRLARNLFDKGLDPEAVRKLYNFMAAVLALPPRLELKFDDDLTHYLERENKMDYMTSFERRGLEKGHKTGLDEAIAIIKLLQEHHSPEEIQAQFPQLGMQTILNFKETVEKIH
jgi:hypothetical protein